MLWRVSELVKAMLLGTPWGVASEVRSLRRDLAAIDRRHYRAKAAEKTAGFGSQRPENPIVAGSHPYPYLADFPWMEATGHDESLPSPLGAPGAESEGEER